MSSSERPKKNAFAYAQHPDQRGVFHKFGAVVEVTAIVAALYLGGRLAAHLMSPTFEQRFGEILGQLGYPTGDGAGVDVNFIPMALSMSELFVYQYGAVFALVIGLALIRGRFSRHEIGLTTGRRNFGELVVFGIVAGAMASLAAGIIFVSKELFELGDDTPLWWTIKRVEWDLDLWILMAVGSFALVPILEELAYRGGMLGRLAQVFAPGTALIGIALIFAVMHRQYWSLGPIGYMTLASVLYSGLVFGYAFLRTGSLIPAIIAHAMINVPVAFEFEYLRFGLCLVVIALAYKPIWAAVKHVGSAMLNVEILMLGAMGAAILVALWFASSGLGVAAVWIEIGLVGFALLLAIIGRFSGAWRSDTRDSK